MSIAPYSPAFFFSTGLVLMLTALVVLTVRAKQLGEKQFRIRAGVAIAVGVALLVAGFAQSF